MEYIIERGSACVKAFRDISHNVANFFGDPDRARRHKELKFQEDMRVLVEEMVRLKLHVLDSDGHFVPAPAPKATKTRTDKSVEPQSAIADVMVLGSQIWQEGKFTDFLKGTTYDPALGYPISSETASMPHRDSIFDNGTVFDHMENPLDFGGHDDVHGDEIDTGCPTVGGLGGGDEFSTGEE